jgi:hypothetical protein
MHWHTKVILPDQIETIKLIIMAGWFPYYTSFEMK